MKKREPMAARGEGEPGRNGDQPGNRTENQTGNQHAKRPLAPKAPQAPPDDPVRQRLKALIAARGEDYASLSRLIGRNPTYIQQFITRGIPRRLAEEDRRILARHLDVPETELGAPPPWPAQRRLLSLPETGHPTPEPGARDWLLIPFLGRTGRPGEQEPHDSIAFAAGFIQALAAGRIGALAAVRVEGDCMAPTLLPGDQLLVDADALMPLRDGLHVLRIDGALAVRRIAVHPATCRLSLLSDNGAYPPFPDCDPSALALVGRVVWIGRRLG